jgi:hypothetical protein
MSYPRLPDEYWKRIADGTDTPVETAGARVADGLPIDDPRHDWLFEHPLFEGFSADSQRILAASGYTVYDVRSGDRVLGLMIEIGDLHVPAGCDDRVLTLGDTWRWRDVDRSHLRPQFEGQDLDDDVDPDDTAQRLLLVCEHQIYVSEHPHEAPSADWIVRRQADQSEPSWNGRLRS